MKKPNFNFRIHRVDVQKNEKEVLEFLHSLKIFERGKILSPEKEKWFKIYHYLYIFSIEVGNGFAYKYVSKQEKYEGVVLKDLTFLELRHIFA